MMPPQRPLSKSSTSIGKPLLEFSTLGLSPEDSLVLLLSSLYYLETSNCSQGSPRHRCGAGNMDKGRAQSRAHLG